MRPQITLTQHFYKVLITKYNSIVRDTIMQINWFCLRLTRSFLWQYNQVRMWGPNDPTRTGRGLTYGVLQGWSLVIAGYPAFHF